MVQGAEYSGSDGIKGLSKTEKLELIALIEEQEKRKRGRKLQAYYPDSGPLRRELYPKHLEFFAAGSQYRERLMLAGNRIGKTRGRWWVRNGSPLDRAVSTLVGGEKV